MINVREDYLKLIKDILWEYIPEYEVRVFGSRLGTEVRKHSDLDLIIMGKSKIDRRTCVRLKEAFEESIIPFRVDVLDWNTISDEFKKIVNQQYEVIQEGGM